VAARQEGRDCGIECVTFSDSIVRQKDFHAPAPTNITFFCPAQAGILLECILFRWLITLLVVLVLALQYRLWFGEANLREVLALRQAISTQQQDNEKLLERNRQLEAEVQDLKKGLAALEERARSEMGMIREDETFIQLIEPRSGSAQ
jgi:cell division protein FtsB